MSFTHLPALALAAAIIDATIGYPLRLRLAIGTPARWMANWLRVVEVATERRGGRRAFAVYLAPIVIAAAVVAALLPSGPIGFAVSALLASSLCGRQSLDARGRAVAVAWESDGPYEALAVAEELHPDESEPRLARAVGAAIGGRFADEVAAQTVFIVIGGLTGAAFCRAICIVGHACRDRRDTSPFGRAAAAVEAWTLAPAARLGALWIAAASAPNRRKAAFAAAIGPGVTPTRPAEAAAVAALNNPSRDEAAYVRRALGLFRRAGVLEVFVLAALAAALAFWR